MMWVKCIVTRAGPAENGTIFIALQGIDKKFNSRWFKAYPKVKNEMLTTALMAISTGKNVTVNLTGTAPYSTINRLYVNKRA